MLQLSNADDCAGHPVFGASFEGLVIENILMQFPEWNGTFYRTQSGAEIDLILSKGTKTAAIEIKATKAPKITQHFHELCNELSITKKYIISLVDETYPIKNNTTVCNLAWFLDNF